MKEYIKTDTPFKERILFLFTGLIRKEHIISKSVNEPIIYTGSESKMIVTKDTVVENTDIEIEDIPFFDLDQSDTKSNL